MASSALDLTREALIYLRKLMLKLKKHAFSFSRLDLSFNHSTTTLRHQKTMLSARIFHLKCLKMAQSIQGSGMHKTEKTEREFKLGLMVVSMKDIGKMIRRMVEVV